MAEVTGDFGGQPIVLNNAATESTLKELVAAMGILSAKLGGKAKSQAELEKELKKFQDAVKKNADALKGLTEEEKKAIEEKKKAAKAAEEKRKADDAALKATYTVAKGIHNLGQVTSRVVLGMTNLLSSLSNVGNSMSSAAATMNNIPVVGGALAGVFGAVAEASEKLLKSYQAAATVGVTFNGSMNAMVNAASGAGLTFDQFTGIIAKNGEALAFLGGTAERGAKIFAQVGKDIRGSRVGTELLALGYSTEQVNNGMAGYLGMMSRTGATQGKSTAELARSAGQYLKELDGLAKLTGQSREALQKEQEARLKDAQFRAMLVGKTAEEQANIQALMSAIPEEHKEAFKDMLTTGNMTSDAAVKFAAAMPGAAQAAMRAGQDIQNGGKITKDAMSGLYKGYVNEAKAVEKSAFYQTQARYNMEEFGKTTVGVSEAAARSADGFDKALADQEKTTSTAATNQAAQMEQFKQQLAETSNVFTQIIAQSGLLEKLQGAFDLLVGVTLDYVVPTFNFLADNFDTVVVVAGVLGAAFMALQGVVLAANVVTSMKTLAETAALAPLAAMAAAVWAAVSPVLAVVAPFVAVAAAGYALWKLFQKFGGDMNVVTDGLKYMWGGFKTFLTYLKLGFYKLLDSLPGIDYGKEIEETQAEIAEQQLDREQLADKMADRMAENRKRREEEEAAESKKSNLEKARERIASREAAQADKKKASEAEKAAQADKNKADAAAGIPTDVGTGDPLKDIMLYNKKRAEEAAGGPGAAAGQSGFSSSTSPGASQAPADMQKYLQATALIESGGNTNAKAGTSSAGGMFQFLDSTWKQMVKEMGKDYTLQDKFDPKKSAEVMAYFTQKQQKQLEGGIGRKASNTDLYMSHFLGAGGATKFINAMGKDPNQSAASLDPAAAKANKSIYYDTRGKERSLKEVYELMGQKMAKAESAVTTGKWGGKDLPQAVAEITAKNQPTQLASAAPKPAPSAVPVQAPLKTTAPTAQAATQATQKTVTIDGKQYAENSPEAKAALEAQQKKQQPETGQPTTPQQKPQETAETLLATLNSKVDELISVTRDTHRVNQRQLGVMAENSSNVYAMGA